MRHANQTGTHHSSTEIICPNCAPNWCLPITGYPPGSYHRFPLITLNAVLSRPQFHSKSKEIIASLLWLCTGNCYRFRSLHSFLNLLIKYKRVKNPVTIRYSTKRSKQVLNGKTIRYAPVWAEQNDS